jgi:hypothetical protein
MRRVAAMLLLAAGLAACSVVDTMVDGFKHTRAVESALETSLGTKPAVGFNWHNGRLTQVSVTFPQLLDDKPLRELAETVRAAVTTEFKQVPDNIVLGFALGKSTGKSARAE